MDMRAQEEDVSDDDNISLNVRQSFGPPSPIQKSGTKGSENPTVLRARDKPTDWRQGSTPRRRLVL